MMCPLEYKLLEFKLDATQGQQVQELVDQQAMVTKSRALRRLRKNDNEAIRIIDLGESICPSRADTGNDNKSVLRWHVMQEPISAQKKSILGITKV